VNQLIEPFVSQELDAKNATGANCGKTCNLCKARENMQPLPIAGKYATSAKRGKTCNLWQSRKNRQPLLSAGKHETSAKGEKTRVISFCFVADRI